MNPVNNSIIFVFKPSMKELGLMRLFWIW